MMRSFFVLLALLAIVTSTASPTCGRALLHRIQSVCGLCTIDAHHELIAIACSRGLGDKEIIEMCCPI
ncbi:INSulin related [Caenorhabditis elegans]|uniref:INSulin related n=1 Tax=Caenorhabditis elegans TaxID=6239 RepID=Q7JKM9_CAEEL|nr:INSulin related [Caenorhabditis elegans]CAE53734.1 INSulin related [Caenorhabditis elegans]|eukprot:NP_001021850.1 INSulin related [Caenorhabditis elegans]